MTGISDEQVLRAVKAFIDTLAQTDHTSENWIVAYPLGYASKSDARNATGERTYDFACIDGSGDFRPAMRAAIEAALKEPS